MRAKRRLFGTPRRVRSTLRRDHNAANYGTKAKGHRAGSDGGQALKFRRVSHAERKRSLIHPARLPREHRELALIAPAVVPGVTAFADHAMTWNQEANMV